MKRLAALCVAGAVAFAQCMLLAAPVSEETAEAAASAFLAKSAAAQRILPGRAVSSLEAYGGVWLAHLAPSGYIELAGSTKCTPVLSFSEYDFTEPEPGSPLAAKLLADGEWCNGMEADASASDNPQWQTFAAPAPSPSRRLLGAPTAGTSNPFVDSFIGGRWSQGAPMSDLTPRRSPCGCVATAAGQEFRYWQWPYRFESVDTFTHTLVDANGDGVPYVIRLDGRVAIDWDKVAASGGSSTPYAADKTTAYNTALLTAWMQEFGGIVFKAGAGSGSRKVCSSAETAWYEAGPVMSRGRDGYANLWTAVTNDLASGTPIQINTPVHQMVIDGYAVDNAGTSSEVDWINTNYGWGNPTSWENFDTVTTTGGGAGVFADFQTGFRPMKIVQFEPVPRVSNSTVPLTWHIAPCYTNKINGFTIQIDKFTDATSLTDDFSASTGSASGDKFKVEDGYLGGYPAIQDSTYTYPDTYFATSSASLTFNTKSRYMNGHTATVEIKANSGSWTTAYTIALTNGKNTSYDTPVAHNVDLSAYAGKAIQLRFRLYCTWAGYTAGGSADFRIDDVSLTGVKGVATTMNTVLAYDATYPSVYNYTAEELENGSSYAFTVAPFMSDLSDGRTNTVTTTIGTPAAAPEIEGISSIAGGIDLVQEGFFIECARGAVNDIAVTCSESTTSLAAFPSHLSILPDEKVTVEKSGNVFTVHVDATDMMSTKKFWDGDMLILTLVATNADGTEAYKNLMLRFNSMRQVLGGSYDIAETSVDSAVWFCGDTTLDAMGQNVTFAANAFMGSGCTVTLTNSVGGGSFTFSGLDGFTGTLAFSGALDVTLPEDMSGFSGTISITDGTYTLSRNLPATATLELGESMPTVYLDNATIAGAITGYGEVYVTSGTCAVTGSIGAGAYVMLSGGTLELAQGLEPRVGQTGGTLKIQLTPYQTTYGYSALIQNYASGTILLVDSDGNEITPTISGDPAVIYPPTLATTTASYTGNANVWTGTDALVGGKYSTTSLWSKNALPSNGDYVIFNDASTDGYGALMSLNAAAAVNLGYVKITGNTYFEIDTFSSDTSAIVTADVLENEISTKLDKEYFQPLAVVPRAKLLIANGMKFACDIDYTLATNLKTRNYTTSGEYNAIQYSHAWEGTVVFTNYTAAGLNPGEYGNSNSVVRLSGVEGWLANNKEYAPTVELVDYGTKPALKWNNGSASSTVTFDAISGDGIFQTASPSYGGKESVVIKDVSKFTGSFNLAAKKVAIADAMPSGVDATINNGRLFVCKEATVAPGANWWANGGIHLANGCDLTVKGTLDATSMLTNDTDSATLTLDGGVLKVSSALKGGNAPTMNFKAGTYQITADVSESSTVNFCAGVGEYTTLDANGHKLTLPASFFSGSGDIYLTSSVAGGSFVITGISTDYTGTIYAEESLKVTYPDDLSTQGGIINIAGATLAYSSAKLGAVRVDEGGTLTVALTDEEAMTSFDASSLVTLAGGVVEFVDSQGTVIVSSSETAAYTRPASYTLAPSATAVWISGEFKDAASEHGGYEITTNMAGYVNSAGNIVIGGESSYIGAMLNLSTVTNCTKASVLVKFKSSLTGAPAANAAIMGVISSDGYPISPICTTEDGTAFTGAYLDKGSDYALVTGNYAFSTTPTYPTSGEGYMLFSYQSDQGSSAVNGTAFYVGDTIASMAGGNKGGLQWRQKTLTSFYIGGPASTTIPTWEGLEIEAVALFVDEWYAPADVKWFEFPAAPEPEYEGPAPTAVWVAGEFGDHKSAHAGYQISLNGNTTNELGQVVIGSSTTLGATIAVPEDKGKQVTMLVKYSIPSGSHSDNSVAAAMYIKNNYELGALADSGESALKGYWLDTRNNGLTVTDGDFAFSSPAPSVPQSGYILVSNWSQLPNTDGHGTAVYTGETIASLSGGEKTGLRFTGDNNCITNVSIGGPTKAGAVPWAGMVVEGVAIFDSWVTPDDITGYKFPEQGAVQPVDDDEYLVEPAAVWVNDFKTAEKNGYTLSVSGTTDVLDDTFGGTLTIGDAAAVIDVSAADTNELTVLVKYAAAPSVTSAPVVAFGGMAGSGGTIGLDVGAYTKADKTLAVYRNYSTDNGKPYDFTSAPTLSATGGYLLCARDNVQGFRAYVGDSLDSMTGETLSNANIKFSNVPLKKIGIGGGSSLPANANDMVPFTGFVVEKIVVFSGYYTPSQLLVPTYPEDAATLEIGANATWNFAAGTTRTYESIGALSASGTIAVTNETLGAGVYKLAEWTTAQEKSTGYGHVGTLSTPGLGDGLTAELVYGAKAIYLRVYDETAQSLKPTLKVWPYGDSITEGFNASDTKANYRVLLAQKLSLLGYNVEMVGCYDKIQTATAANLEFMNAIDPSGAVVPDAWKWHSAKHGGTVGVTAATSYQRSAMVENVDTLAAQVGNPDVVLLHGGINDLYASGETPQSVFEYLTNTVWKLVNDLPDSKIIISTCLYGDAADSNRKSKNSSVVEPFNTLVKELVTSNLPGEWSGRVYLADLNSYVQTYRDDAAPAGITVDRLHPDWWGHDQMAEGWLSVITNVYTTANGSFPSNNQPTPVNDEELGAAAKEELATYRDGFTLARTIDVASTNVPEVVNGEGVTENIGKVGYFVEYVRGDNEAHKWVWVDMDAFGSTIDEMGLPTANHQCVVSALHVKSSHAGIEDVAADDDTVTGFIEFSPFDYTGTSSDVSGAPTAHGGNGCSMFDWNDTLGSDGSMGCMQVFRKSPATGRPAQLLFAYNNWQSAETAAEFGIGNFAQHFWGGAQTLDYTYTKNLEKLNAAAYRVKRIEIWTKEASGEGRTVYYKSGYWGTGGDTTLAVTLADGTTTTLRDGDTIVIDSKSSNAIYFGPLPDYANKIRVSRDVVFSSGIDNASILDGATIEIDEGKTVTFKCQYHDIALGTVEISGLGSVAFDANGLSLDLDPNATVNGVAVRPALDEEAEVPFAVIGSDGKAVLKVKPIPGLWYSVLYGSDPTALDATTEAVQATQSPLVLEAPMDDAPLRFYRIRVAPQK